MLLLFQSSRKHSLPSCSRLWLEGGERLSVAQPFHDAEALKRCKGKLSQRGINLLRQHSKVTTSFLLLRLVVTWAVAEEAVSSTSWTFPSFAKYQSPGPWLRQSLEPTLFTTYKCKENAHQSTILSYK